MCVGVRDLISCRPGLEPGPIPRDFPFARYGRRPSHNRRHGVWVPARRPGRRTVAMHTAHRFQLSRSACSQTQLRILAARCARALLRFPPPGNKRVQGKPGARCTRGLVCKMRWKKRTRAYRFSGEHPAFPAQWFYGLLRDLPGETSSIATVACRIGFQQAWRQRRAPERRDFAVRSSHARQSQLSRPPHPTARS